MEFCETTRHNQHNGLYDCPRQLVKDLLQTWRLCCGLVTDTTGTGTGEVAIMLRTCYGETGVMDFSLKWSARDRWPCEDASQPGYMPGKNY